MTITNAVPANTESFHRVPAQNLSVTTTDLCTVRIFKRRRRTILSGCRQLSQEVSARMLFNPKIKQQVS